MMSELDLTVNQKSGKFGDEKKPSQIDLNFLHHGHQLNTLLF